MKLKKIGLAICVILNMATLLEAGAATKGNFLQGKNKVELYKYHLSTPLMKKSLGDQLELFVKLYNTVARVQDANDLTNALKSEAITLRIDNFIAALVPIQKNDPEYSAFINALANQIKKLPKSGTEPIRDLVKLLRKRADQAQQAQKLPVKPTEGVQTQKPAAQPVVRPAERVPSQPLAIKPPEEVSVQTKLKLRLAEPAVQTALATILCKYEDAYLSAQDKAAVAKKYAGTLIQEGREQVVSLKVTDAIFLPLFTEHILAMQQSFTTNIAPAIKGITERMLDNLMERMKERVNVDPEWLKKPRKVDVTLVRSAVVYDATDYAQQLQTANSELSSLVEEFIVKYVWSYAIATKKEVVVVQYVRELMNDLIRAYIASQEDEEQVIPFVTNYLNVQQKAYLDSFNAAMGALVKELKAQTGK